MLIRYLALIWLCLLPAVLTAAPVTWDVWMDAAKKAQAQKDYAQAEIGYRQAIICTEGFPVEDARVLDTLLALDSLYRASNQTDKLSSVSALAIARLEKAYGEKDPRIANLLYERGKALAPMLNAQAEPLLGWALAAREDALGLTDPALTEILLALSDYYERRGGQREKAEPLLQRILDIMHASGRETADLIPTLMKLASLRTNLKRYQEACALYQRILDLEAKHLSANDPQQVVTLYYLANMYYWQLVKLPEAMLYQQRILRWYEETGVIEDSYYETALRTLAEVYVMLGYYAEAETLRNEKWLPYFLQRVEIRDWTQLSHAQALGAIYRLQGRYREAENALQRRLEIQERLSAKETDKNRAAYPLAEALLDLAECTRLAGKPEEAAALFARAKEQLLLTNSVSTRYMVLTGENPRGTVQQAEESLQRTVRNVESSNGLYHWRTAMANEDLGNFYLVSRKPEQAEPYLQKACEIWEKMLSPRHRVLLPRLAALAGCKTALGKTEEAEQLYRRAIEMAEQAYGADAPILAPVLDEYAALLRALKRDAEATTFAARAADIRRKHP